MHAPDPAELQPQPAEGVSERYRGPRGEAYWKWQTDSGARAVPYTVPYFSPYIAGSARLVDVGCGGGYLLEGLSAREKVGVEPNDYARAAAVERGLDVRRSLRDLPDDWADVIISNHALEHATEPHAILREARRVLRSGGQLLLMLPINDWRREAKPTAPDIHGHLYTWTPQLVVNLLTEVGFTEIESRVVTRAIPPGADRLRNLWPQVYELAAWAFSVAVRRRQTFTAAVNP